MGKAFKINEDAKKREEANNPTLTLLKEMMKKLEEHEKLLQEIVNNTKRS